MPTPPIRVLLVEDQRAMREALVDLLGGEPGLEVTGAHVSMEEALARTAAPGPDVALLDVNLPGMSGIEGVRALRARFPRLQALMLTVREDDDSVFEAICAGACGYLLKDTPPERVVSALRELAGGGAPMSPQVARRVVQAFARVAPPPEAPHGLTPRELELLGLLAEGHGYKTAARTLGCSIDTVRFHVRNVYEKLHVHSKSEAVSQALRRGLIR
jgi:DNA-binding NarL/FixJ family response regulator